MPARTDVRSICVLGSGPVVIGQAAEFDYSGTQAVKALMEDGYRVILVNSNPATIMTDPQMAHATYIEPLTPRMVREILRKERPDALLPTVGGQTALNLAVALAKDGTLDELGIALLGAEVDVIECAENRQLFKECMQRIGLECLQSRTCKSLDEAREALRQYGLPIVIRPSFTLGGSGGGIAFSEEQFEQIVLSGLTLSPTSEVLIEESALGWKEYEFEVMRDQNDNAVIVCSIENLDPMGVHTGDSITVAPAQTLTDKEYQYLRDASLAILRAVGVRTGGSNVQFAVHRATGRVVVIEMNPRVSRSSALASKATGYPIAKIAAKVAIGYTLDEITNDITKKTKAAFEPSIDYVVVKMPRFAFEKFHGVSGRLGTQMQSVGEAMAIGRSFQEALGKALCSLEYGADGLESDAIAKVSSRKLSEGQLTERLQMPSAERIWIVAEGLRQGLSVDEIHELTFIDRWFLQHISNMVALERRIANRQLADIDAATLWTLKQAGFSDRFIARLVRSSETLVASRRSELGVLPVFKRIDTCAGEFEAFTPYLYSTYERPYGRVGARILPSCEAAPSDRKKVVILGGGPIRIGQGIEFDYCCVQAVTRLSQMGFETIMVNCNPETVSTDYDCPDRLYFEPLTFEHVMNIVRRENPYGVIVQLAGQTPLKLARQLEEAGVRILGTSPEAIDVAEDRRRSSLLVSSLSLNQPPSRTATSVHEARTAALQLGYPLLLRPSYVLGGRAMELVYDDASLNRYMSLAVEASEDKPLLLDRFLDEAIEVDVDLLCDGRDVMIGGVMQHIEEAGIHSGDSSCVLPPHDLDASVVDEICAASRKLALALQVVGLANIQFAVQNKTVYVLEVNPRASRTVPFVSKATGLPLAGLAAQLMVGSTISDLGVKSPPIHATKFSHCSVKEAVMPFIKFPETDSILGPEMRSTGEVMGIAQDFNNAFAKSQIAAGMELPLAGTIFVSIATPDKERVLPVVRRLYDAGFRIIATTGTHQFLSEHGIASKRINKVREGSPHILEAIADGEVDLMFNTILGPRSMHDSHLFRRKALELKIPYYTTVEAADAASKTILHLRHSPRMEIKSLQEHIAILQSSYID